MAASRTPHKTAQAAPAAPEPVAPANGAPEVPPTPDYTQQAQQAIANAQAADAPQVGMEVGNAASQSMYAPMGADGQPDLTKLQSEPVEGYGVQIVAEGDVIDQATYARLNANS